MSYVKIPSIAFSDSQFVYLLQKLREKIILSIYCLFFRV